MPSFDHVLLVGFGSPERIEDLDAFLKIVSAGRNIPEERLKEVRHHYELIGGSSPYNPRVFELGAELARRLSEAGLNVPVYAGMRNWHPFLSDVVREITARGLKRGRAVILSPYRSTASCARYRQALKDALLQSGAGIDYEFVETWSSSARFVEAQAELVNAAAASLEPSKKEQMHVLFSAHSIPAAMLGECTACDYRTEHETLASAVASRCGLGSWSVCYQSRSGNPREPWLEPDLIDAARAAGERGRSTILVVPSGFLVDNAEVLYDIDIEAREVLGKAGLDLRRAETIGHFRAFVECLAVSIMDEGAIHGSGCPNVR